MDTGALVSFSTVFLIVLELLHRKKQRDEAGNLIRLTSPVVPIFVHIVANQGQVELMKVLVLIVWEWSMTHNLVSDYLRQ